MRPKAFAISDVGFGRKIAYILVNGEGGKIG